MIRRATRPTRIAVMARHFHRACLLFLSLGGVAERLSIEMADETLTVPSIAQQGLALSRSRSICDHLEAALCTVKKMYNKLMSIKMATAIML